jgi:hypothetical protein
MGKLKQIEITPKGDVLLHLPGEEYLKIGELREKTLIMNRNPDLHLMRQWNAYGINAEIVDNDIIDSVVISEPNKVNLFASVLDVKAHGRYHTNENGEHQYYLDKDLMEKI